MTRHATSEAVRRKFELLRPLMNERLRRHWAASEALTLPRGGVTLVAQATGLSRTTIWAGLRELRHPDEVPAEDLPPQRMRHAGAGRPLLQETDPTLVRDLEALVEATTRGDPQSPLRWTCNRLSFPDSLWSPEGLETRGIGGHREPPRRKSLWRKARFPDSLLAGVRA